MRKKYWDKHPERKVCRGMRKLAGKLLCCVFALGCMVCPVLGAESHAVEKETEGMIPLRAVVEAAADTAILGWDQETQTATVMMGHRIASVTVGESTMLLYGTPVALKTPAVNEDGVLMMAYEDVGHILGWKEENITWNQEDGTLIFEK